MTAKESQHTGGLHLYMYTAIRPRTGGEEVVMK